MIVKVLQAQLVSKLHLLYNQLGCSDEQALDLAVAAVLDLARTGNLWADMQPAPRIQPQQMHGRCALHRRA